MTARGLAFGACAILAGAPAAAHDDAALTDLDRRVMVELTGTRESSHAVFHFRPDGIDSKALDEDVAANVAYLAELEHTLRMGYHGHVHIFLYQDGEEMERLTEVDGAVAFATGTVSVHQPHDFRGVHELVHIFAVQFERDPDTAGADLFVTEGLATYLAKSDENVAIHAWAAAYAKLGVLPASLGDLRRTFPDGADKGVHAYHVAGSFVGFLVERYGIEKVKQWYVDSSEAHQYFGQGFARLEREWREFLQEFELTVGAEEHVLRKLGFLREPLPKEWANAKGTALFDGRTLAGLAPQDASKWSVKDGLLVGTNDGPWTRLATAKSFGPKIGVRAKLRLASGDALKLLVNGEREAIFARWSSYATAGEGFRSNDRVKIAPGEWVELVVVNDDGRARVYMDGLSLFDLPDVWNAAGEG
ncbi:MAG: hypothetical protein HOP15_18355, partial [Planctomycetes bacterium]|nr:hypothetical protein [Planctomycetota bacterium]